MPKKYSFEFVYNYFLENGCSLISKDYINSASLLDYICSCGNPSRIRFSEFKKGQRCMKCKSEKLSEKYRHTYEYVYNYFKEHKCELLSNEYKNNSTNLEYICSCGNPSKITFSNFQQGQRCRKCTREKTREQTSHSYEFVKQTFTNEKCILLSIEYVNVDTLLDYICSCGNPSKISFKSFQRGSRCKLCGYKNRKNPKYNLKIVTQIFEEQNCVLLSKKYKGTQHLLEYICSCGNYSKINLDSFLRGVRCKHCGILKRSGENNCNWKGGITPEIELARASVQYKEWRKKVFKRDNYTCQVCGDNKGGNLQAHHLKNFSQYKELRFDVDNGMTMCESCHDPHNEGSFHYIYGTKNNTIEQFEEFKRNFGKSPCGDFFISKDKFKGGE